MDLFGISIGVSGASLILVAFLLNQMHKWKDNYFYYDLVNLIGSALLLVYAILLKSLPFAVLNSIWALFSLRDVYLDLTGQTWFKRGFFKKWLK